MSDEFEEIVDNIREPSFWKRLLLMIAFAVVFYIIILPLILVLTVAQLLFTLITGESNANLRYFSATLALYVPQVIEFLTYLTEVRPYPFSDLPEVGDDFLQESKEANTSNKDEAKASAKSTAVKKAPATKKKAVKAKPVKKKAVKKKAAKNKAAKQPAKTTEKTEADTGSGDASDS